VGLESVSRGSEPRFNAYVEALSRSLGHANRGVPFRSYCTGLLLPGPRKSVEPMAARVEPGRVQAAHQSLHHLVAKADWSDEAMLTAVRQQVMPAIGFRQRSRHGPCSIAPRLGIGPRRGRPDRWNASGAAQQPFRNGASAPLRVTTGSVVAPAASSSTSGVLAR
jgi:hypothetical protein